MITDSFELWVIVFAVVVIAVGVVVVVEAAVVVEAVVVGVRTEVKFAMLAGFSCWATFDSPAMAALNRDRVLQV